MNPIAKSFFFLLFFCITAKSGIGQVLNTEDSEKQTKMEWFQDAKLGIFIHWGIYAEKGVSESWSFFNNYLNHDAYMEQLKGFNAKNYVPADWVKLIKASGARYSVITSKHHDGVALWDSKQANATTTVKNSAAKRDLLSPFVSELKKAGLRTGIYFSLPDWSYPDYDVFTRIHKRYDLKQSPERFSVFQQYMLGQLSELSKQYKPDLLWFDGDWEHSAEEWQAGKVLTTLRQYNKNIIVNSRLNGHGDYDTPEQGIPVVAPENPYWELNYTMNDSWGYQPTDHHYKTPNMIIRTLVDCLGNGGNFLLDIGPKADGTIPAEQVNILKELGRWTHKHAEAIYQTRKGIPPGHVMAKTALSKDEKTLFIYLENNQNYIWLRGIQSAIKQLTVVGTPSINLSSKQIDDETLQINIPNAAFDKDVTVLAVHFTERLQLKELQKDLPSLKEFIADSAIPKELKIERMANALNRGANIFQNSALPADGIGFKPAVEHTDATMLKWTIKHAEALYRTGKGLPPGHFEGPSALSEDKQTIYLFVKGRPTGPIALKGIKNTIARIRVVGDGRMIKHSTYNKLYWSAVPGIHYIDVPEYTLDDTYTVIAVLLNGPVELYREHVGAIESNL